MSLWSPKSLKETEIATTINCVGEDGHINEALLNRKALMRLRNGTVCNEVLQEASMEESSDV